MAQKPKTRTSYATWSDLLQILSFTEATDRPFRRHGIGSSTAGCGARVGAELDGEFDRCWGCALENRLLGLHVISVGHSWLCILINAITIQNFPMTHFTPPWHHSGVE